MQGYIKRGSLNSEYLGGKNGIRRMQKIAKGQWKPLKTEYEIEPKEGYDLHTTIRSFMIVIVAGLGNLPGVALSGMGLGVFEEFADYILGTEFRIGSVFLLLVLILVYRRFKLSKKREYLKWELYC